MNYRFFTIVWSCSVFYKHVSSLFSKRLMLSSNNPEIYYISIFLMKLKHFDGIHKIWKQISYFDVKVWSIWGQAPAPKMVKILFMGAPSAGLMLFIGSPSAATARAFTYLRTWFEDNNILLEDFFYFSKIGQQRIIKSVLLNRVLIGPIKNREKKSAS